MNSVKIDVKTNGNKSVFGYVNSCMFNSRPEGDEHWFLSREDRNRSLKAARERGLALGLSKTAVKSGLYPIETRAGLLSSSALYLLEMRYWE